MLLTHKKLVRGAISVGNFNVIDDPRLVFGKSIIRAYELETIQNWSGILLAPEICKELKKSNILNSIYNVYPELPLKDGQEVYSDIETNPPYALNWQRIIKEVDWTPFYENAKKIVNEKHREKAICIVRNTEKFLKDMNEQHSTS